METVLPAPNATTADFDTAARLHRPAIFRFLAASLRDTHTAENLTQECLLRAFQARDSFRGEASVKTWLMQIAVNVLRNHLSNARFNFWKRNQQGEINVAPVDPHSSPEAAALARQQIEAVWKAATKLSERQRTVFLLRFVEDMDLLDIAAATGLSEGTVKSHLFRAVQSVRQQLEGTK